jgi:predicted nucleic acid-binding protein
VLLRPEQRLMHGLSEEAVKVFLATLAGWIEPVNIHFRWRPQMTDAKDEMVLEAALNGRADASVTHNVRDFTSAAARFGLAILKPQQILEKLR